MRRIQRGWTTVASAMLVSTLALSWGGCASDTDFDAQGRYTPESLAQELALRFRDLSGEAKVLSGKPVSSLAKKKGKEAAPLAGKELTKSGEASNTKAELAKTADALLEEIAEKAREVPKTPPGDVCRKMARAIRADNSLPSEDREVLAKRLEALAGEF